MVEKSPATIYERVANDLRIFLSQPAHLLGKLGVSTEDGLSEEYVDYLQFRGAFMGKMLEIAITLLGFAKDRSKCQEHTGTIIEFR